MKAKLVWIIPVLILVTLGVLLGMLIRPAWALGGLILNNGELAKQGNRAVRLWLNPSTGQFEFLGAVTKTSGSVGAMTKLSGTTYHLYDLGFDDYVDMATDTATANARYLYAIDATTNGAGYRLTIFDGAQTAASHPITVWSAVVAQTVNGSAFKTINSNGGSITLVSDGVNYLAEYHYSP